VHACINHATVKWSTNVEVRECSMFSVQIMWIRSTHIEVLRSANVTEKCSSAGPTHITDKNLHTAGFRPMHMWRSWKPPEVKTPYFMTYFDGPISSIVSRVWYRVIIHCRQFAWSELRTNAQRATNSARKNSGPPRRAKKDATYTRCRWPDLTCLSMDLRDCIRQKYVKILHTSA